MSAVICRGAVERAALVHRWPVPIPYAARLVCGDDEEALFVRHGALLGGVGSGTHSLRAEVLPFLGVAVGAEIDAELWFVSRGRCTVAVRAGFAGLYSARYARMLAGAVEGSAELAVSDSRALLGAILRGARGAGDFGALVAGAACAELRRAAASREVDPADLMAAPSETWQNAARLNAAIAAALAPYGIVTQAVRLRLAPEPGQAPVRAPAPAAGPDARAEELRRFRAALGPGFRVRTQDAGGVYVGTVVSVRQRTCVVAWDGGGTTQIEVERLAPPEIRLGGNAAGAPAAAEGPSVTMPSATSEARAALAIAGKLGAGTRVVVQHTDGRSYPAVVQQFQQGWYEVAWENGARAWVPPHVVTPS